MFCVSGGFFGVFLRFPASLLRQYTTIKWRTTIYNKYKQKQQHIHNNQTGEAFLMLVLRSCFCWSSWFDFVFELLTSQQSTAHTTTSSKKSTTSYNKRNKTTRQTTIKRLGRFLSLVSSGCPGSFLCSWLVSQQNRQHTTTSCKNTTTTYNNLQQMQQKQQHTQQ
jgi:hypothetical protein